jgi:tetratricopeptide (TPR) repeat protein
LSDAKTQAANDQKQLPSLDKEARAAATGTADVGLGAAYLSYGQVDKAIEALERGIKKGGVKRLDDAQMALGRAYLKANRREDAAQAFDAVPDDSKLARVADLWAIYARQAQPAPPAG